MLIDSIPAKLLTDIDNAKPRELWDRLAILADWLEESGDLRADGIRWLRENEKQPKDGFNRYKPFWFKQVDYPTWLIFPMKPHQLPRRLFFPNFKSWINDATKSAAYLAAAQAFVDSRYGTEATERIPTDPAQKISVR